MKVRPRAAGARRGVLLLVILALLAMFGLVAVAFVVVTGHAMRSSQAIQRMGQFDTRPDETLHQAFLQVVRGTNNWESVLRGESLLEDIYGDDAVEGAVPVGGNAAICRGQLIEFTADARIADPDRRAGCVLTMLDGPAAGRSTRVVAYVPDTRRFQVLAFDGVGTDTFLQYVQNRPCNYVINGTPFSGAGAGFNPYTGKLDLRYTEPDGWPLALLPRPFLNVGEYNTWLQDVWKPGPDRTPNTPDDRLQPPPAVANEDYDAVDFQNLLLAAQIMDHETGRVTTIPSLHRPALARYWTPNLPTLRLYRKAILRPAPFDHPQFTGSNPGQGEFNPLWDGRWQDQLDASGNQVPGGDGVCDYAWDVDNDGDGQTDGIWVDLGMPVRSTADGRLYKPLFSILCVDLDGRLNLNAHGCLAQTDPKYYEPAELLDSRLRFAGLPGGPIQLPRGQGYGPAEVNLLPLLEDPISPGSAQGVALYRQLLAGSKALGLDGRYGEVNVPAPMPGYSVAGPAGQRPDDLLSQNKGFEFWHPGYHPDGWSYWGFFTDPTTPYVPNAYGTPPDFNGNGFLGLDVAGRPLYPYWLMAEPNEQVDDPYELNLSASRACGLSSPAPLDNPFGVAELEKLLRPFDRDACLLPERLAELTKTDPSVPQSISVLHKHRHEITTASWDLPCPAVALPKDLREALQGKRPQHLTDLLRAKKVPENVWKDLLPPEMLAGLKLDLNRPLGDGRDNNGNGVVDEPGEPGEQLTLYSRPGVTTTVPFSYGQDGTVPDSLWARQLQARYLYVLMLLLMDDKYGMSDPPTPQELENRARLIAQWAVNVVDFRDRDSIMTPFPYDPQPFDANGWSPPSGPQYVVWGCERPELLITETLAFHDRRTEDLEKPAKKVDAQEDPDDDYDQRLRPEGSLFIELFNPWTEMEPSSAVDLARMAGPSPVWRLVVALPTQQEANPDDPNPANRPDIERSIYFRDPSGFADRDGDGQRLYPNPKNLRPIAPILAGRYAVIGPGEGKGQEHPTHMGFKTTGTDELSDRRIVLTPKANPEEQQVAVFSSGAANDFANLAIQPAVAVVIDPPTDTFVGKRVRRLSVSEPIAGYPPYETLEGYEPVKDLPLDDGAAGFEAVMVDGTTPRFRVVYLQRLANPLIPYNQQTNPYRTIDSMQIDLTAFNGLKKANDAADPKVTPGEYKFYTRERGERDEQQPPAGRTYNLWAHEHPNPPTEPPKSTNARPAPADDRFTESFAHTLGYLNEGFQPLHTPMGPADVYRGSPQAPFPWLNWNNRPFISQLELLLVPATDQFLLLHQYGFSQGNPQPYESSERAKVPFPHLLNFFHSAKDADASAKAPDLHRLLEYVHVPSRFVGTELQGNPDSFKLGAGNHPFHPPFNRISTYREPGRINLNTIFSEEVFRGLMGNFSGMSPEAWKTFVQSRRGYPASTDTDPLLPDPRYPTRFARPFRSFAGGAMVPPIKDPASLKPDREIDATLLRADPNNSDRPLFRDESAQPYNNTDRNPYFRYQGLQRLGNLVTTRSNVYAIWITVGYFEVRPWTGGAGGSGSGGVDAAHPDGYMLGQELGIETGEVQRHRAFYIFDRSIPVGFRRGQDLNVEEAVLVRRFIE